MWNCSDNAAARDQKGQVIRADPQRRGGWQARTITAGGPELSLGDGRRVAVGAIVYAVRNRGAFGGSLAGGEFAPLRVSPCRDAPQARVLRSFEGEHIDLGAFNEIVQAEDGDGIRARIGPSSRPRTIQ